MREGFKRMRENQGLSHQLRVARETIREKEAMIEALKAGSAEEVRKLREKLEEENEWAKKDSAEIRGLKEALEKQRTLNRELARRVKDIQETSREREDKLRDIEESFKITMDEECTADEKHCACVPLLRHRVKELEDQLAAALQQLQEMG